MSSILGVLRLRKTLSMLLCPARGPSFHIIALLLTWSDCPLFQEFESWGGLFWWYFVLQILPVFCAWKLSCLSLQIIPYMCPCFICPLFQEFESWGGLCWCYFVLRGEPIFCAQSCPVRVQSLLQKTVKGRKYYYLLFLLKRMLKISYNP